MWRFFRKPKHGSSPKLAFEAVIEQLCCPLHLKRIFIQARFFIKQPVRNNIEDVGIERACLVEVMRWTDVVMKFPVSSLHHIDQLAIRAGYSYSVPFNLTGFFLGNWKYKTLEKRKNCQGLLLQSKKEIKGKILNFCYQYNDSFWKSPVGPFIPNAFTSLRLSESPPLSIWTMTNLPEVSSPEIIIRNGFFDVAFDLEW